MFAAIDANIQKFFRGFNSTQPGGYEDPTALGFSFQFNFKPATRNPATGFTEDALFADPGSGLDSAQYYLNAIGYPNRANMLNQFKQQLEYINTNTPWYFQTLEGLADAWSIPWHKEGFNNYRGKDKILTINCLESIDLRMTALADLYRKATFDPETMRSLLPDNLRWFTLVVRVFEIRKFQKVLNTSNTLGQLAIGSAINPNSQNTGGLSSTEVEDILNFISCVEFQFSECEFDFNESFPIQDTINMGAPDLSMAKSRIKIETHHIKEVNTYTLLNLLLRDGPEDRSQVYGSYFNSSNGSSTQMQMPNFDSSLNPRTGGGTGWNPLASRLNSLIQGTTNPLTNAVGQLTNAVQAALTKAVLGNVYDLANQSLGSILNEITGGGTQPGSQALGDLNALNNTPTNPNPLSPINTLSNTPKVSAPLDAENIYK